MKPLYILTSTLLLVLSSNICAFGQSEKDVIKISMLGKCLLLKNDNLSDDLDKVMFLATKNLVAKASKEELLSSKYDLKAAQRFFIPSLSISGTYGPNWSKNYYSTNYGYTNTLTEDYNSNYYMSNIDIIATWNLLDLSQISLINSLEYTVDAHKRDLTKTKQELAQESAQTFLKIQKIYNIYLAYKDLELLYYENIATTNDLIAMGLRSKIDLMNSQRQLLEYQSSIQEKMISLEDKKSELSKLLNTPLCTNIFNAENEILKSENKKNLVENAISLSPTIQGLELQEKSLKMRALSQKRNYMPTIYIEGNVNGNYLDKLGENPYYNNYDTTSNTLFLGFNWSVFDGGINKANYKSTMALAESINNKKKQSILDLKFVINKIRQTQPMLVDKNNILKESLEKQQKITEAIKKNYILNFSNYYDFQSAAQTLLEAKLEYIESNYGINSNTLDYENNFLFPSFPLTYKTLKVSDSS